uniref:L-aspartate oxidase n=1 Tax=Polytomella parva TaxID=51329 RepID=A0A7S0YUI0_9CHLO|mmetsp:Transcript_9687/g.18110  ORF Transcript_9687/g.18110 Transcript_9687/m.18110 type:complete len:750 (+) Transcript_9687:261-2510(+)
MFQSYIKPSLRTEGRGKLGSRCSSLTFGFSLGYKTIPSQSNLNPQNTLNESICLNRIVVAHGSKNNNNTHSSSRTSPNRPTETSKKSPIRQCDFLVMGSGIAGLTYALKVAPYGTVAIVTKNIAKEGCTRYAQGGVCAVLDQSDSVESHIKDTVIAGAHLNDVSAVDVVCREARARVLELVSLGADFTRNPDGSLHLTREGGHSNRRIVHAADLTGAEIERALLASAQANPNIHFYEHHATVDLVIDDYMGVPHCLGADVLDLESKEMMRFVSLSTMIASGGAGQVFPNTTNPHVSTGDGIAMAYRAGAVVSNLEFVQFHPTSLYVDPGRAAAVAAASRRTSPNLSKGGSSFLITEAVRGEGGMLFNQSGERFMERYDNRLELAPRDIVARSIHDQLVSRNEKFVLLDISHKPRDEVLHHFPNIARRCQETLGLDISKEPIPVVPAQHYTCGGVNTGLLAETSIQGLFACGEVACSGLHGANRLASNSLLEGLVFADRAVNPSVAHAEHVLCNLGRQLHYAAASADFRGSRQAAADGLSPSMMNWVARTRQQLREAMWRNCGIVRRSVELAQVHALAVEVREAATAALSKHGMMVELIELQNLATVAELTVACALQRKESRGLHYTLDYPNLNDSMKQPSYMMKPTKHYSMTRGMGGGGMLVGGVGGHHIDPLNSSPSSHRNLQSQFDAKHLYHHHHLGNQQRRSSFSSSSSSTKRPTISPSIISPSAAAASFVTPPAQEVVPNSDILV